MPSISLARAPPGKREGDWSLSATHDANAWPADRYAGLPAPAPGERVVLWVQNSHPVPIPAGGIGLNRMGDETVIALAEGLAPFASRPVDVAELLPDVVWPAQIELRAGKHVVRPRYEIIERNRRRIAHVNVERGDLVPDPNLPRLSRVAGQGISPPRPGLAEGGVENIGSADPDGGMSDQPADRCCGL